MGILGFAMLGFFVVLAAAAPLLTPYNPYSSTGISAASSSPSWFTIFNPNLSPDTTLF
ncbi:MAG: hypothetical protein HY296_01565 [Thaumarchaeota archaeon]|nr:hypothetical protein [Nitrososphaerota archaeon]